MTLKYCHMPSNNWQFSDIGNLPNIFYSVANVFQNVLELIQTFLTMLEIIRILPMTSEDSQGRSENVSIDYTSNTTDDTNQAQATRSIYNTFPCNERPETTVNTIGGMPPNIQRLISFLIACIFRA